MVDIKMDCIKTHFTRMFVCVCLAGCLVCSVFYIQTNDFHPFPMTMSPKHNYSHKKTKQTKDVSYTTFPAKSSLQKNIGNKKHIVCVAYLGRQGNNMFQFAAGYAITKKKGLNLIVPESNPMTKVFNIPISSLPSLGLPRNYCSKIKTKIADRWHCSYDSSVQNQVSSDRDIFLNGYFQSWKYWTVYEENLRKLFTFKPNILNKAVERIRSITVPTTVDTVLVGIHVRRGDYIAEARVGRTIATEQYFKNAINYFRKKYSEVVFVVVTDDFKWCKTVFRNESKFYFMEGNTPAVDMAIMSLTNHTIISVGSFSWWSAWLANGTTIYYQHLFKKGSGNEKNYRNISEFVYPGWIPMS